MGKDSANNMSARVKDFFMELHRVGEMGQFDEEEENEKLSIALDSYQATDIQLRERLQAAQELLQEIYDWTEYKNTEWATRTKELLDKLEKGI